MMEEQSKNNYDDKMHRWCGWCGVHRFSFLRLVIAILILWFVFWAGVKVGEFKSLFGYEFYGLHGYYSPMMMRGSGWDNGSYAPGYQYPTNQYPGMTQPYGYGTAVPPTSTR